MNRVLPPSDRDGDGDLRPEFALIERYFKRPAAGSAAQRSAANPDLGIGDDAALITPAAGMQQVLSTDLLVAGRHFFPDTDACDLGWKTLAVNLSDLAAMGAKPRWALLALALPSADEAWLSAFSRGFFDCAAQHQVELIGGDTTRTPAGGTLTLCVTAIGEVPTGTAIGRHGAQAGDDLWVSGQPGRAALGLAHLRGELALRAPADCLAALHRPQPRIALGLQLRGVAHAMLDVSDGLLGDLRHLLLASQLDAELQQEALPLAPLLACGAPHAAALQALLSGGDDYELLFAAPPNQRDTLLALGHQLGIALHRIGRLTTIATTTAGDEISGPAPAGTLRLLHHGQPQALPAQLGFDHFAQDAR